MKEINIEKIMEEIRTEIKEKGYKEDALSFKDIIIPISNQMVNDEYSEEELKNNLNCANNNWQVLYYRPLFGNKIIVFIKKVIRKLVKFLIYPIIEQQSEWNANIVRTLNQMARVLSNPDDKNDRLDRIEITLNRMIKKDLMCYREQQAEAQNTYMELIDRAKVLEKENKVLHEELEIVNRKIEILELQLKKIEISK